MGCFFFFLAHLNYTSAADPLIVALGSSFLIYMHTKTT
jgi:hypothetical protein